VVVVGIDTGGTFTDLAVFDASSNGCSRARSLTGTDDNSLAFAALVRDGARHAVHDPCRSDRGVVDVRFGVPRMSNTGAAL
jgi:N-methylhydantoinase A/oxoprolinase/acetone carboxylase beta subunit